MATKDLNIGVLAIQGDVDAHVRSLRSLGVGVTRVLRENDVNQVDALVIPGGESTTISKGLARLGLHDLLTERIRGGLPVLGTCAGAILLARAVDNNPVPVLGAIDAIAVRNAYGTQVDSFATMVDDSVDEGLTDLRCVFIRAPRLRELGPGVEVLARVAGEPILVREDKVLAATFHPELTEDNRVHALLIDLVLP